MLFSSQIQKTVICHNCHCSLEKKIYKIGEDLGLFSKILDLFL